MASRSPAAKATPAEAPRSRKPEFATQATGATHPRIEQTPPFVLVYSSSRWMVHAGKFVPSLSRVPLVAGVNRVEQAKNGKFLFANTRARLEMEGRTVILMEWAPDGESYLQVVETRPGGRPDAVEAWISVWETATVGSESVEVDEEGYAEWLEGLVKSGKLPACPYSVAKDLLDRADSRLRAAQSRIATAKDPGLATKRAEALSAEVKVLQAYVDGIKTERAQKAGAKRGAPTMEG